MKLRIVLCGVVVLTALAAGCKLEKRIESNMPGRPGPPDWVMGVPQDTAEHMIFVGMALAENVLDERTGRNRAMEDARDQIAASLTTNVVKDTMDIVKKKGAEIHGNDITDASYWAQLKTMLDQALPGVRQDDYYWEQWRIRSWFLAPGFTKYKCYIRVRMPREDYEKIRKVLVETAVSKAASRVK